MSKCLISLICTSLISEIILLLIKFLISFIGKDKSYIETSLFILIIVIFWLSPLWPWNTSSTKLNIKTTWKISTIPVLRKCAPQEPMPIVLYNIRYLYTCCCLKVGWVVTIWYDTLRWLTGCLRYDTIHYDGWLGGYDMIRYITMVDWMVTIWYDA